MARKYQASGDVAQSKNELETLPSRQSFQHARASFEIGRVLIASADSEAADRTSLRRTSTEGDNHYEAQFCCARELLPQGYFDEADRLFTALDESCTRTLQASSELATS